MPPQPPSPAGLTGLLIACVLLAGPPAAWAQGEDAKRNPGPAPGTHAPASRSSAPWPTGQAVIEPGPSTDARDRSAALLERLTRSIVPFAFEPTSPAEARLGLGAFDPTPIASPAVRGARAKSRGFGGLKLWAAGAGYSVGRRSAGYGLEGGAALPLDDRIDLTAGYRLSGFAAGSRLDPDLSDVDGQIGVPFVGVDVEF